MFLSRQELAELTGREQAAAQRRWLDANGIKYLVAANGMPKVLLAELQRHMLGGSSRKAKELNLSAIA